MKYKVTNKHSDADMTSFVGEIVTTYDKLVETFGEPLHGGDKVTAEWVLKFSDGKVATIYDWKQKETPKGQYPWHIGGHKHIVVKYLKEILGA